MESFLRINDLIADDKLKIVEQAQGVKAAMQARQEPSRVLPPHAKVTYASTKPSVRTDASIHEATRWAGGHFDRQVGGIAGDEWEGFREPPEHIAKVLSAMGQGTDILVVRGHQHEALERMAEALKGSRTKLLNGLTVTEHPLQALGDLAVLREKLGQQWRESTQAFIGPWNNVSRSLAFACADLGIKFRLSMPKGVFKEGDETWEQVVALARQRGSSANYISDPMEAATGAHCLHADVWQSMGDLRVASEIETEYAGYKITPELMARTQSMEGEQGKGGFLHCMPIHRAEVDKDAVANGPQSWIIDQAGHRATVLPPLWDHMGALVDRK